MEVDVNFLKLARQAGEPSTIRFVDPLQIKAAGPVVQSEGFIVSFWTFIGILEQYLNTSHGV
jgi:hypothetical protein